MKVAVDRALWKVDGMTSPTDEFDFNCAANDIDFEIDRCLTWLESKLRESAENYHFLQNLVTDYKYI